MGKTSNESKRRWNSANYVQVKVSVRPEIAMEFKARCLAENVSMAGEISKFMTGAANEKRPARPPTDPYKTRPLRRKALSSLIGCLEKIMDAEMAYMESIPENLRNSQRYEAAESSVSAFEEALEILAEAY